MDEISELEDALASYSANTKRLPGISRKASLRTLALQLVASRRRFEHSQILRSRHIDEARRDPSSARFDPERAAVLFSGEGNHDEAIWLVFLATHFGKHRTHGWLRLRDVYSGSNGRHWTWRRVSADPTAFRNWLHVNQARIRGSFSNHRKYESLNARSANGTGAAVASFVAWVGSTGSPHRKLSELVREGGNSPEAIFDHAYRNLTITRFGRLAKFEFLDLLGRMEMPHMMAGIPYLTGATGPLAGARLLFDGNAESSSKATSLDGDVAELGAAIGCGMNVMEDALCNWQKSPTAFVHFKG